MSLVSEEVRVLRYRLLERLGGPQQAVNRISRAVRRFWILSTRNAEAYCRIREVQAAFTRTEQSEVPDLAPVSLTGDWGADLRPAVIDAGNKVRTVVTVPDSDWWPSELLPTDDHREVVRELRGLKHRFRRQAAVRTFLHTLLHTVYAKVPDRAAAANELLKLLQHCRLLLCSSDFDLRCNWPEPLVIPELHGFASTDLGLHEHCYCAAMLCSALLPDTVPSEDIHFWLSSNIRRHYNISTTPDVVAAFHRMSAVASAWPNKIPIPDIADMIRSDPEKQYWRAFLDVAANVRYIIPAEYSPDLLLVRPPKFDAEFLLASLLGVQVAIPGLSRLFSGGIRLGLPKLLRPTAPSESGQETERTHADGKIAEPSSFGRLILIRGEYGAGKSILSHSLAADIARKGGVAIILAMESPFSELKLGLANAGVDISGDAFHLAGTLQGLRDGLLDSSGKGVLALFSHFEDTGETSAGNVERKVVAYQSVFEALKAYAERLPADRLRVLVVDPVNALDRETKNVRLANAEQDVGERFATLDSVQAIKRLGCNIILTAEEDGKSWVRFGEDIADTVIQLRTTQFGDYFKRVISITKSRFQREHRGEHPFSIVSGKGMCITVSTPAVSVSTAQRSRVNGKAGEFGIDSLAGVLRTELRFGDVVLLRGPVGTLKTQIGLAFLHGSRLHPKHRLEGREAGLVISNRYTEATIDHKCLPLRESGTISGSTKLKLFTCTIPKGFCTAGHILQLIEDKFAEAREVGCLIDRILIDNPSEWADSCPLTAYDRGFLQTLIGVVIRRREVITVVTDRMLGSDDLSSRLLLQEADCRIDLDLVNMFGAEHVTLHVRKTRSMEHSRQLCVLTNEPRKGLRVREAFFDVAADGTPQPLTVRILGHVETHAQFDYWTSKIETMKSAVSPNSSLQVLNRFNLGFTLEFAGTSAAQEIQILALDEFELQWGREKGLRPISRKAFGGEIDNVRPRISSMVHEADTDLTAVPIYDNLSLFLVRRDADLQDLSWHALATKALAFEKDNADKIFFDFPKGSAENYNCIFLEILLALIRSKDRFKSDETRLFGCRKARVSGELRSGATGRIDFCQVLKHPLAAEALELFAILARKAFHRSSQRWVDRGSQFDTARDNPDSSSLGIYSVDESARVIRHWYSTLAQHTYSDRRDFYDVALLPENVSTSGQWYLGVPRSSRQSRLTELILKSLTTREAELDRLHQQVGLPVRHELYRRVTDPIERVPLRGLSPGFFADVAEAPIQRSCFDQYSRISNVIAEHLMQLLAAAEGKKRDDVKILADNVRTTLCTAIGYVAGSTESRPAPGTGLPLTGDLSD